MGEKEHSEQPSTAEYVLSRFVFLALPCTLLLMFTHPEAACDFLPFHKAGVALLDSGNPYDAFGYLYPPFFSAVVVPYSLFPWEIAVTFWKITCLMIWAACVYRIWEFIFPDSNTSKLLAVGGAAMLFLPMSHGLFLGQTSLLMLLMLLEGYRRLRERDSAMGGVLLGLVAAIKLFPGLLVVPLFLTNRRKAALWMMGTLVATLAVFPTQTMLFVQSHVDASNQMPGASGHYVSLSALISRLFVDTSYSDPVFDAPMVSTALTLLASGTIVLATIVKTFKVQNFSHGFAMAIIAMLLVSPGVGFYHMDLALVFATIWVCAQSPRLPLRPLIIAAVLLALPQRLGMDSWEFLNRGLGNLLRSPATLGLVMLFVWMLMWRPGAVETDA